MEIFRATLNSRYIPVGKAKPKILRENYLPLFYMYQGKLTHIIAGKTVHDGATYTSERIVVSSVVCIRVISSCISEAVYASILIISTNWNLPQCTTEVQDITLKPVLLNVKSLASCQWINLLIYLRRTTENKTFCWWSNFPEIL